MCGKDDEILENFSYLGSVVCNNGGFEPENHMADWPGQNLFAKCVQIGKCSSYRVFESRGTTVPGN